MRRVLPALVPWLLALLAQGAGSAPAPAPDGPARVGRLQGSASLGRNREVVGATVLVTPAGQRSHVIVTASDAKGQFRIDGLPDGDYRVEVRREGLQPVVKDQVGLRFPARAVLEVLMQPLAAPAEAEPASGAAPTEPATLVRVAGGVTERDGEALPDIPLRFVRPDGRVDPVVATTGADGSFALPELPAGRWRLETRVVGFLPIRTALDLGQDIRLDLSMVRQPAGYVPSPLDLAPPERPIPPQQPLWQPPPHAAEEPGAAPAVQGQAGAAAEAGGA